jgi:hypothetical protein
MAALTRRAFLSATLGAAATPLLGRAVRAAGGGAALPAATLQLLETSPYVYVSPLGRGGAESTCHGEVWFAWLGGAAVVITARDRWKARSLEGGLDRARIWVGDHGPWKKLVGRNEEFRSAPGCEARARFEKDPATLERLIAVYEKKYPAEIGRWRDRFKTGFASGERVLIAYQPVGL